VSVVALLPFGEILPQAVCSRHALSVGAALSGVVKALMFVMAPLAISMAAGLEWLLGSDHTRTYSRSPKNPALQQLQKSAKSASTTPQRPI